MTIHTYTKTMRVSETIPLHYGETFDVHNGRGKLVERWRVIDINTKEKRKYMTVHITDFGVIK